MYYKQLIIQVCSRVLFLVVALDQDVGKAQPSHYSGGFFGIMEW